ETVKPVGRRARSSSVNKKIASQQATPVVPVDNAPPDDPFNDTVDSDVEEDDSKEIPPKELECTHCTKTNSECQITPTASRCQPCASKKRGCSRTDRGKYFNVSWKKAEEARKQGLVLVRKDLAAPHGSVVPNTEEDVRTKEPVPIVASIEASAATSAPLHADHKRRKVLDTQVPVQLEPEATSASTSNPGRNAKERGPVLLLRVEIRLKLPAPKTALGGKSGANHASQTRLYSSPVVSLSTEKRLDAMEARLQKGMHSQTLINRAHEYVQPNLDLPRASMSSPELNGTIEELESNGEASKAQRAACGRCTRRSLTKMWISSPPAVVGTRVMGVLIDDPDAKSLTFEGYEGTIPGNLEGETALGDGSTILVDNTTESPILENGLTIADP
ncbi:hypothetical protein B0H14DRAFT_2666227, partial [Mycena olivaceomarginata]